MAVEMKLGQYSSSASLIGLCLCITPKKLVTILECKHFLLIPISVYLILSVSH